MTAFKRVMVLLVALAAKAPAAELSGRFVRVSIPGREKILSLAEVKVMSCGRNVALKMKATQSSTDCGGVAGRAVDGNTDGNYGGKSVTHTKDKEGSENPWWMVELAGPTDIEEVVVYNRDGANERLLGAVIEILDGDGKTVFKSAPLGLVAKSYTMKDGKVTAQHASRPASARKPSSRGPSYSKPKQNYGEMIAERVAAVYTKKTSWRETVIAARDALWKSEGEAALKWLDDSDVSTEVLIAGPFKAEERDRLKIELTDGAADFKLNGRSLSWRATKALELNVINDLAEIAGLGPGECALIRVDFARPKEAKGRRPDVSVTYCGEFGCAQLAQHVGNLNVRKAGGSAPFLVPDGKAPGLSLEAGKTSRLYIAAKADADGKCEVAVIPRYRHFDRNKSIDTQMAIAERAKADFPDAKSRVEMKLELADDIWHNSIGHRGKRSPRNWFPGRGEEYLAWRYREGVKRLVKDAPARSEGLAPENAKLYRDHLARVSGMDDSSFASAVRKFHLAKTAEQLIETRQALTNAALAVGDQVKLFGGGGYPAGRKNLARLAEMKRDVEGIFADSVADAARKSPSQDAVTMIFTAGNVCDDILLQNPALGGKLIMVRGKISPSANWTSADRYGDEIVTLEPVSRDGKFTSIYRGGPLNSIELDWDAEKILISDNSVISEIDAKGGGEPRVIRPGGNGHAHDPCRLPDGRIVFSSTTVEQAVPCTGGGGVGNLHIMDADGRNERRLCYDQDHNWHPTVMENGRVMFLRWEYTGQVHYFSRIVMTMNPDGTDQVAHYGSNSYWPNSTFWPRQIPGVSSLFCGVVSGHHGVKKEGELHLFDVGKGRFEADGAVQKIGARGVKVEPIIRDNLVDQSWPHFVTPYPLGTGPGDGAGKYFLATGKMNVSDGWGLYLVDVFDNMTLIKKGELSLARPFAKRRKPRVIPDRVDVTKRTANVVISNIYFGPGLKDVERGAVKALRIASPIFRYPGNGDTFASAADGGWDVKRIIGTVPVEDDGSASFVSPVNVPILVQPLNAEGQALQLMRSWFTPMPGASVSCIGCHESQNDAPPRMVSRAMLRAPSEIEPWNGPARGFSFRREVQPVLDRRCAGCHDGSKKETLSGSPVPDFRASGGPVDGKYSRAYMDLQRYVRRAGVEPDAHLFRPTEFMADTSHLVKMLKKGHKNVRLTADEWERLYTWIDLNVPYPGNWTESHRAPKKTQVASRMKYLKLYASIVDTIEDPRPLPPAEEFRKPAPEPARKPAPRLDGWPFDAASAKRMQKDCGLAPREIDLGDGVKMKLVPVPSGSYVMGDGGAFADEETRVVKIDEPFYVGSTEVTFGQYRLFDPDHESGFIEERDKDRSRRGVLDMSQGDLPVVRVTQRRAVAFCEWLSKKSGMKVSLPTEEQWEWAARAGSGGRHYLDAAAAVKGYNIVDEKDRYRGRAFMRGQWNYGRIQKGHDDGQQWVEKAESFTPNPWGLYNVLGNVSEWTATDYRPLEGVGVTREAAGKIRYKTVRGGSWNDTAAFATLASRWRYTAYQPVYDVGFRVVARR